MERAASLVRAVTRALHWVAAVLIVATMLMTVANILGRWLFDVPVPGTVELTQLALVGIVFLGFAYAQLEGDHITVDLLHMRLPRLGRLVVDAIAGLVTIGVLGLLAWQLLDYRAVLEASGRTTGTLRVPLHLIAWIAVLGAATFLVATLTTLSHQLRGERGSSDDTQDRAGEE